MMNHPFLLLGSILGGLGVAIGAFGAHALKSVLEANDRVGTFELAGKYHLIHAITPIGGVLLIAGWICLAIAAARLTETV